LEVPFSGMAKKLKNEGWPLWDVSETKTIFAIPIIIKKLK